MVAPERSEADRTWLHRALDRHHMLARRSDLGMNIKGGLPIRSWQLTSSACRMGHPKQSLVADRPQKRCPGRGHGEGNHDQEDSRSGPGERGPAGAESSRGGGRRTFGRREGGAPTSRGLLRERCGETRHPTRLPTQQRSARTELRQVDRELVAAGNCDSRRLRTRCSRTAR